MGLNENMDILVVDDSGFMRKIFIRNLNDAGFFNVEEASDGEDAVAKLTSEKFDLVISDWNMPKRNGLEVLQWMRMDPEARNIPFIMATAQGDKARVSEAFNAGANAHIAKPFTSAELKEKIEIALGLREPKTVRTRDVKVSSGKVTLRIGHIQITDHLLLGIIRRWIDEGKYSPRFFYLETVCMSGWNPIQETLEKGEIDGAFVLAPIAMDLFAYDVPIQLVSLAHRNGSIFVRSKHTELVSDGSEEDFFLNRVIQIPHKMSVHHMLAHQYLHHHLGMHPGVPGDGRDVDVIFEVVPPVKMPVIMKDDPNVAGFIVAEPVGSNAISKGLAELQFLSSQVWEDHPCCVVVFQDDIIGRFGDAVHEFCQLLNQAGKFVQNNTIDAANIAVSFLDPDGSLGLNTHVLFEVLTMPGGITMDKLYPRLEDLDRMQRYMYHDMNIGKLIELEKFVDGRFAE
ncbi:MAG: response regulator [Spirochaetales bacterium]|nr:response regulator [Spirochaetales bacterium]